VTTIENPQPGDRVMKFTGTIDETSLRYGLCAHCWQQTETMVGTNEAGDLNLIVRAHGQLLVVPNAEVANDVWTDIVGKWLEQHHYEELHPDKMQMPLESGRKVEVEVTNPQALPEPQQNALQIEADGGNAGRNPDEATTLAALQKQRTDLVMKWQALDRRIRELSGGETNRLLTVSEELDKFFRDCDVRFVCEQHYDTARLKIVSRTQPEVYVEYFPDN